MLVARSLSVAAGERGLLSASLSEEGGAARRDDSWGGCPGPRQLLLCTVRGTGPRGVGTPG